MQDVSGKVAFVTGAASGIGLGIAKALARAGARVMLCDIEEAALAWAVEALKPSNAEIAGVKADVSLKRELQAAADATIEGASALSTSSSTTPVSAAAGHMGCGTTRCGIGRSASI